ncbi:MAG: ABC transporter permease [Rhizobiaceae bacterium]|nr:ABC transporter permease [Rhizobiaceae bacterium]
MKELATTPLPSQSSLGILKWVPRLEFVAIPIFAVICGFVIFSIFLVLLGKSPTDFFALVYKAGFSTAFSWQNTLSRAAPLLLAALCVALPAKLGLVVIGGEGAIALGAVAAGAIGAYLTNVSGVIALPILFLASAFTGAFWIGLVGFLRIKRGVNETIASLLMAYIAIAISNHLIESVFRDPASLNKPSTASLSEALRVGAMPIGIDVHWGFLAGLIACIVSWILVEKTTLGFSARIAGGNIRAAQVQGLPVAKLIIGFTALGGAIAGIAGFYEVTAVHGSANASVFAGYGYTGILIAFLARHNALAIVPITIMLAGFEASSGLIQRRMDLPDATILVFEGIVFVTILFSETLYGRFRFSKHEYWKAGV